MKKSNITVKEFLQKNNTYTPEVATIAWHTSITYLPMVELAYVCGINIEILEEEQVAKELAFALLSCQIGTEDYNDKLYMDITRLGLKYHDFKKSRRRPLKPENISNSIDVFEDDGDYAYQLDQLNDSENIPKTR